MKKERAAFFCNIAAAGLVTAGVGGAGCRLRELKGICAPALECIVLRLWIKASIA